MTSDFFTSLTGSEEEVRVMASTSQELQHVETERNLVEEPRHEMGVKMTRVIFGLLLLGFGVFVLYMLYSAMPR